MPYREYQPRIAPPWLLGKNGRAWLTAVGDVKDSLSDRLKRAVTARFPTLAPTDALAKIGEERGIRRAVGESDESYAARVADALSLWAWAGTPTAMFRALWDAGFTEARIELVNGGDLVFDEEGIVTRAEMPAGNWLTRATRFWSDFVVLFTDTSQFNGETAKLATLRSIIAQWKPAFATCKGIVVIVAGRCYDWPATTWTAWGASSTWSGNTVNLYEAVE